MRLAAADKLDDKALAQEVYAHVAKNTRRVAIEKLTDQTALTDVALNAKYGDVRLAAADRLDDKALAQTVYADIAQQDEDPDVRKAAVERLTDHALLTDIARNAVHTNVRFAAVDKLGDKALEQEIYADLAKKQGRLA